MACKGLTLTDVQGLPEEVDWPPGHRISLWFLNAIALGGLLVGSVYLTAGKGYTGPNIQFPDKLGEILVALRRPFVIGGVSTWPVGTCVTQAGLIGWGRRLPPWLLRSSPLLLVVAVSGFCRVAPLPFRGLALPPRRAAMVPGRICRFALRCVIVAGIQAKERVR